MARFSYSFRLTINTTFFLSLFVFVSIAALEKSLLSNVSLSILVYNLALTLAFLSVPVTASSFHPEDPSSFEVQATLPRSLWKTIFETTVQSWAILWLVGVGITSGLMLAKGVQIQETFLFLLIGYAVVILFFGSLTFLGIIVGRDSRVGVLIGLLAVAWMYVFPDLINRGTTPGVILNVMEGINTPEWSGFRFGYFLVGVCFLWLGMKKLSDTDYLLIGSSRTIPHLSTKPKKLSRPLALSQPLMFSVSRMWGMIIYEGILSVAKGPLPIVILLLWWVFSGIVFFVDGIRNGGFLNMMESGAIGLPFTMQLFFMFILPIVLVMLASTDQKTHVEEVMLSVVSPQTYLGNKILGITTGVLALCLLGAIPATMVMFLSVLQGRPIYFIGFLSNLFLGIFPLLIYITVPSVLTGHLAHPKYLLPLGGGLSVILLVASWSTAHHLIGNFIFPSGQVVAQTIAYPIYVQGGLSGDFAYDPNDFLIVSTPFLFLPLLSAILQSLFFWWLASKWYEKSVTTR